MKRTKKSKPRKDAGGVERRRPAFADTYPRDDELDRLVEAFANGNMRLVRAGAEALEERSDDEDVRAAARNLRRRLNPDPLAVYLLGLGVALVLFLYAYYAWFAR